MEVSLNVFDELCTRVSNEIDNRNLRKRSRTESEHTRFKYAVKYLLTDLWKTYHKHPEAECSINKRSGYYSENDRYRDPNLTYKMTIKQAFQGLIDLDLIRITKDGYYIEVDGYEVIENLALFDVANNPILPFLFTLSTIDPYYTRYKSKVRLELPNGKTINGDAVLEIMDLK